MTIMKLTKFKSPEEFIMALRNIMRVGGTVFLPSQMLVDIVNECAACEGLPGRAVLEDYSCDCWREIDRVRDGN